MGIFSKMTDKIFLHYGNKRPYYWLMVFVLPFILATIIFLWHIEVRNMKITCYPEQTWFACFNGNQDYFVLKGVININMTLYPVLFCIMLIIVFIIEILAKIYKRKHK